MYTGPMIGSYCMFAMAYLSNDPWLNGKDARHFMAVVLMECRREYGRAEAQRFRQAIYEAALWPHGCG